MTNGTSTEPLPVSKGDCAAIRADCRKVVVAEAAAETAEIRLEVVQSLAALPRIEEQLRQMGGQISGLVRLHDRVGDLEKWKAQLNGRAAALAANPAVDLDTVRTHIEQSVAAMGEQVVLKMSTRSSDGITVPRWAAAGAAALVALIVVLALFAGRKTPPEQILTHIPGARAVQPVPAVTP